jgi:uncharacterized membrane protein
MDAPLAALTLAAILGCGLSAGAFFAFSSFVMKALARLPAAQGIAAMQAINVAAVNLTFMLALFGTAAACIAVGGWALAEWEQPFAPYLLTGAMLYLAGAIAPTVGYHVPRNDALARVEPSAKVAAVWRRYVQQWTAWNHLRATAPLAAAAALTWALHLG